MDKTQDNLDQAPKHKVDSVIIGHRSLVDGQEERRRVFKVIQAIIPLLLASHLDDQLVVHLQRRALESLRDQVVVS